MKIGNNSNADNVKVCQGSLLKGQPVDADNSHVLQQQQKKNNRRKT